MIPSKRCSGEIAALPHSLTSCRAKNSTRRVSSVERSSIDIRRDRRGAGVLVGACAEVGACAPTPVTTHTHIKAANTERAIPTFLPTAYDASSREFKKFRKDSLG